MTANGTKGIRELNLYLRKVERKQTSENAEWLGQRARLDMNPELLVYRYKSRNLNHWWSPEMNSKSGETEVRENTAHRWIQCIKKWRAMWLTFVKKWNLLLSGIVKSQISWRTVQNIFQIAETISQSLYTPDLSLSDYSFFLIWKRFRTRKILPVKYTSQTSFKSFFDLERWILK